MLVLLNITIEPSNLSEKNKRTIECDKSTITQSDVIYMLPTCGYGTPKKKEGYGRYWDNLFYT